MKITNAEHDIDYILFTSEQIQNRIAELGAQLSKDYEGVEPILVCILKGSTFFFADLSRAIKSHVHLDFMSVSSYGSGTQSTGVVKLVKDLDNNIEGRDVLIVEDIIDSGLTLKYLKELLSARRPKSIKVVTLLDKQDAHTANVIADYKGFNVENQFVVGYGLDYADYYRTLPYIGVLKPECYE